MKHLVVGTPMYGGQCQAAFAQSVSRMQRAGEAAGIRVSTIYIGNESLIQRARNAIVWQFLNEPSTTHLLFCDADQRFRAHDVIKMIEADKPVIVGPVPMKTIDWEAVRQAALAGAPAGALPWHAGRFNIDGVLDPIEDPMKPVRINRGGAGFMLIKREALEAISHYPGLGTYIADVPGVPEGSRIHNFFPTPVTGERLMSEDYGFCNIAKAAGEGVWLAPWVEISHFGTYEFTGRFYGQLPAPARTE